MTERRRSTGSGVMLLPGRRQCGLCLFTASVTCFATIRVLSGGRTNTVVDGTSQTIQVKANLISLEISGAPRGSSSLARFADGVLRHLVRPSSTCRQTLAIRALNPSGQEVQDSCVNLEGGGVALDGGGVGRTAQATSEEAHRL